MLKVSGNFAGSLTFQSTWNASTNVPFLQSSVGTKGFYYVVSVAGNTNLNGITNWNVGDWAVFDGTVWEKVDNNNAVTSVNGQTGTVVLNAANVGATPNTTFVIAGTGLNGGGQLVGNVTLNNTGVLAFNTRSGNVTLTSSDVTTALGFTPGTGNGTVTAVTGTTPISSTGGNTPTISISQANATTNGYLSSTDWSTFNSKQPAGTYVTSVTATTPISSSGGTTPNLSITQANATVSGYLSSADWVTFNSKGSGNVSNVATGTGLTGGPITSTGTIAIANTTVTAGSYGNASVVPNYTVNQQGQITAAANTLISIVVAQVSGAVPNTRSVIAGSGLTGGGNLSSDVTLTALANSVNQNVTVQNNGVVVGSQPIINFAPSSNTVVTTSNDTAGQRSNVTIDLANSGVTAGIYGNASTVAQVTIDAKGRVTSASNVAIAISNSAITGLGTMATQNANSVAITGGNIAVTYANAAYQIANASVTGSSNIGAFSYGTLAYTDTSILASFTSSTNSYNQVLLQNTNSGSTASTDYVVSNDKGTASAFYGDYGMNSSNFAGSGAMNLPNAVYLQSSSSDLSIGTLSANAVHIVVNNGATDAVTINSNNTTNIASLISSNVSINGGSINVTTVNKTANTAANVTYTSATMQLVPAGYINYLLNGVLVKIPYYNA